MRPLPFTKEQLEKIAGKYPTPFHIYDAEGLRANVKRLQDAFAWNKGFREYFAVKALPNPAIMWLLAECGCGMDCSSLTELMLADESRGDVVSESNDGWELTYASGRQTVIRLDREPGTQTLPCLELANDGRHIHGSRYHRLKDM